MNNTYKTISGDTWDIVAYKALGDEAYTDKLIKLNLKYRDLVIYPAGIVLDLPEKETVVSSLLPPWKRGVVTE